MNAERSSELYKEAGLKPGADTSLALYLSQRYNCSFAVDNVTTGKMLLFMKPKSDTPHDYRRFEKVVTMLKCSHQIEDGTVVKYNADEGENQDDKKVSQGRRHKLNNTKRFFMFTIDASVKSPQELCYKIEELTDISVAQCRIFS